MPHRRSTRANLAGLQVMRFQLAGRAKILTASRLSEYMSSANIRFNEVADDESSLHANLAHFASHTFAHVRIPRASVEWPRDSASRGRLVVIVAEDAGFTVESDAPIIEREPGLTLIPPGTAPVRFRAEVPTELVFISCLADSLPGIDLLLHEPDSNAAHSVRSPPASTRKARHRSRRSDGK